MQIAGYISTPLQARTVSGVAFHQFRLAVLSGKGEARRTTWFTVRAQLTELDVDLLDKGLRVEVTGILVLHPYVNRQGQPAVEAIIDTRQVVPAPVNPNALAAPEQQKTDVTSAGPAITAAQPLSSPVSDNPGQSVLVPAPAPSPTPKPAVPDTSTLLRASVPVPPARVPASVGAFEDDSLPF